MQQGLQKSPRKKKYQTPYGEVLVNRYVYRKRDGGKIYVPLEEQAKLLGGNYTPKLAKMLSWKYSKMPAKAVAQDLSQNHNRPISAKLVQIVTSCVSAVAIDKEYEYEYSIPSLGSKVSHISIGLDGTTSPIRQEGYRETMCATLSLYNKKAERLHTIYSAVAPESGKNSFYQVLSMEIERLKTKYPDVTYLALADGAKSNWSYLQDKVQKEILDFYHATEYLGKIAPSMAADAKTWLEIVCHQLKNKKNGAKELLKDMKKKYKTLLDVPQKEALQTAICYYQNNLHRMDYAKYIKEGYPIGSGVTEAACKAVVKQRVSASGMRWSRGGIQEILILRALVCTEGRWTQFWNKYTQNAA